MWITRLPTRSTAAATSAITAAPRPRTTPATDATSPYSTYTALIAQSSTKAGGTNRPPAVIAPRTPYSE